MTDNKDIVTQYPVSVQEFKERVAEFLGVDTDKGFKHIYMEDPRGCLPADMLDEDIMMGIIVRFRVFYGYVAEAVESRYGIKWIHTAIEPSYEDASTIVIHTDKQVLLREFVKSWNFYFESEAELLEALRTAFQECVNNLLESS